MEPMKPTGTEHAPSPVEPMLFGDILTVEQLYEVYHSMLRIRSRREDAL